ncbi:hypothetical protein CIT25_02545 [Mesorhizobium mediterraneum]|uniref:Lytic murein transglycosylase n=1 Tax=Mesorhizobium mediterraneum TaxID=43617 RepID=A0AB36RH87_9HYPH|nr:hypothetical protein CIT25_02545 [Mesorhizobium mediterraneum]
MALKVASGLSEALHGAPLCPAGHLPHLGGDRQLRARRQSCNVGDLRKQSRQLISPQVGEMSGRTEGGAKDRGLSYFLRQDRAAS